ncbi:MAG: hypothetical protein V3V16_05395 [Melioribacteraceae bacterium]
MLSENSTIFQNDISTKEVEIAKFRNYGREKFGTAIKRSVDFEEFSEKLLKHTSVNLPIEIAECFIRIDAAPFFGAINSPLLDNIENVLTQNRAGNNFIANHREVKEYYSKWVLHKEGKEKTYYALTLVNMVERNFAYQSFYNLVLYAVILTYEETLFNPKKAIELFERSKELVNNLVAENEEKNGILYFINLFEGFTYFKEYEYAKAKDSFAQALKHNINGISAKFYLGLSAANLNDFDTAFDALSKVLHFDKLRFQFAINYNHLPLFEFFFQSAVIYNVFSDDGFAPMIQDFDFLLRAQYSDEPNSMGNTYAKLINLKNLRNKEFYTEKVVEEINFLLTLLDNYRQKENGLVRITEKILRKKLVVLIEYLRSLVETFFYDKVKDEFIVFDNQIEQNKRQLQRIRQEGDDANKRAVSIREESLEETSEFFQSKKEVLNNRIEKLDKNEKYNPTQIFFSSMIFTVGISMAVFVISGFSASFFATDFGDDGSSIGVFAKVGVIWGGITFIIGIGISLVTGISANKERIDINKKLTNETEKLEKSKQEREALLQDEAERREEAYSNKFKDRITNQENIIESFLSEREQNYQNKLNEAREQIEVYTKPLNQLLKSLS